MRRWLRLIMFLLFGSLVFSGAVFWLFQTTDGATRMLRLALIQGSGLHDLRLGTISGSLGQTLEVSEIAGSLSPGRVQVSLQGVKFDASWLKSLTHAPVINRLEIGLIRLSGIPEPQWLKRLPPPPAWGSFAGARLPVFLRELRVGKMECQFLASSPWRFWASDLLLAPPPQPEVASGQALSFVAGIGTPHQDLARILFQGMIHQKNGLASGTLSGQICGGSFSSEIHWNFGKSLDTVSGFLHQSEWDVEKFNRWLFPLWQDQLPVLFGGVVRLAGSWLVSGQLGLLGNLEGDVLKLHCRAVPLPVSVFEVSGKLALAEGILAFQNTDFHLLGSPGTFSAEIGLHSWEKPIWKVHLEVPGLDIGSITGELPWMVRYSLGLVPVTGLASLTVHLDGAGPEILCLAHAPGLLLNSPAGGCLWNGRLDYRRSQLGGERFLAEWSWVASQSLNPLPRILRRDSGGFFLHPRPPFSGHGKLSGTSQRSLFEGGLQAGKERCEIRGTLQENHWTHLEAGQPMPEGMGTEIQSSVSVASPPSLSVFALVVGW